MKTNLSGFRLIAAFSLAVAACACSDRKTDRQEPAPVRAADAAALPSWPIDARLPELGEYERIRVRFEGDCPRNLPEYDDGHVPYLSVDPTGRSCRRPIHDLSASGRDDVTRLVGISAKSDPRNLDYGVVASPISRVDIEYTWNGHARPPQCDHVIDEAVAYISDLADLPDDAAAQLAATMRSHPWKPETWWAVVLLDRTFYFQYFDHSDKQALCTASFSLPYLIEQSQMRIEEVAISNDDAPRGEGSDAR